MNIAFVTIHVKDLNESAKFYQEVLGLAVASRFKAGPQTEIMFLKDEAGHQLELIQSPDEPVDDGHGGGVTIGFAVGDMEAAIDRLKAHGVSIARGPIKVPSGATLAFFVDPNGVSLELYQPARG